MEEKNGVTQAVATFCIETSLSLFPKESREAAKVAILDCIGVTLVGSKEPVGKLMQSYVRLESRVGNALVVGSGGMNTSPTLASLANGTSAHALDYDDRGHMTTHLLWAGLAIIEELEATKENSHYRDGENLLEAYLIGREVRSRLDKVIDKDRTQGKGPGSRGWHATGIHGTLASTLTAAKLYRLDIERTRMALGIAASQASGLMRNVGTMTKPLHAGLAASHGVFSATLARLGFTADPDILESQYGFINAFCLPGEADIELVRKDLGAQYYVSGQKVRIKPYPSCTGTHPGIDAARRLLAKNPQLEVEDIERIECDYHPYPLIHISPQTGLQGKFSMPYCISATLIKKDALAIDDFTDEKVNDGTIKGLMEKISPIGAKTLRIYTKKGQIHEEPYLVATNLDDLNDIIGKFEMCCDRVGKGGKTARQIKEMILNLELLSHEDIKNLIRLLI